jgi:hypothetical protein
MPSRVFHFAVRGGFEPPVRLNTVRRFSKPVISATHPPNPVKCKSRNLRARKDNKVFENACGYRAPIQPNRLVFMDANEIQYSSNLVSAACRAALICRFVNQ